MVKVAIRNFQMPKSCRDCKCMMDFVISYDDPYGCVFTRKTYNWGLPGRPHDCPLVELDSDFEDDVDDGR